MTRSGRSLLRRGSMLFFLACAGVAVASPVLAAGPAPDPAPTGTRTLRPEPVPGSKASTPPPPPAATTQTQPPTSPPSTPPPAAQTQPFVVVTPPPAVVTPQATVNRVRPTQPRPAQKQRQRSKPKAKTGKDRPQPTGQAVKRPLAIDPPKATSPDGLLLAGGLALVVLVIADTAFLALSRRSLLG